MTKSNAHSTTSTPEVWLSLEEVVTIEGVHRNTVFARIQSNIYTSRRVPSANGGGKNGKRLEIALSSLSPAAQLRWLQQQRAAADLPAIRSTGVSPVHPAHGRDAHATNTLPSIYGSSGVPALTLDQHAKAQAKADLLALYLDRLHRSHTWGTKSQAREDFIQTYNTGLVWPDLFKKLGPISWQTLERWKVETCRSKDPLVLADHRGFFSRGRSSVSLAAAMVLLKIALHPNKLPLSEIVRRARLTMNEIGVEDGLSEATYRRWLETWIETHEHLWIFNRQGKKAWNDKVALSIERDMDLIQVGAVTVADGHKLNFEVLNPFTGRESRPTLILWYDMRSNFPLGWEIDFTENTQSIASALRRAIIRLGKIPEVVYLDNGKAFSSRFFNGKNLEESGFTGAFGRLGVKTIFAWPYHAQSKTVERFFGTFGEIERWMPTYVGRSIEDKPPRLMRGEKLHRRVYDKVMAGRCVTLEMAHAAIAEWFDQYAARPQRGHLRGWTPLEVFTQGRGPGVDRDELRLLMMADENRQVKQSAVRFLGKTYYAPELYGRKHGVFIRYDLQDPDFILVYTAREGEFICVAERFRQTHPAATHLGTDADRAHLKAMIQIKRSQEKQAALPARQFLEDDVLPEHRRQMERLGFSTSPVGARCDVPDSLPAPLDLAKLEAEIAEHESWQEEKTPEPEDDYQPEFVCEPSVWDRLDHMNDDERYETLLELEAQSVLIEKRWQTFMRFFEQSDRYRKHEAYFTEYRAKMTLMHAAAGAGEQS